jgi:ketosteroid isomerase-like protein
VAVETESYAALNNGNVYNNLYHFLFVVHDGKLFEVKEYLDTIHTNNVFFG